MTYTVSFGLVPVPAPPPLIDALQRIEVEASTEMASVFRLRFGITQTSIGDWSLLAAQYEELLFRPLTPLQIRVKVGMGLPQTLITGYLVDQHVNYDDEAGGSVLELTGMDASVLMNLVEKAFPWPLPDDSAIAAAIFAQYALEPVVFPSDPGLFEPEGTVTQRGTDIRFLRRLAQRNGFKCYVQPQPAGPDIGYFGPPVVPPAIAQAVLNVKMGAETNVSEFKIRYEMLRPTAAVAFGLDTLTKAPQAAVAPLPLYPVGMGLEPTLTRVIPPPIVQPAQTGQVRLPGLQAMAQGVVDRAAWAVIAEGAVGPDVGVLRPGATVNIRGAGLMYNGTYYVTRVTHTLECGECGCYAQKFEAQRNAVVMTGAELYAQVP